MRVRTFTLLSLPMLGCLGPPPGAPIEEAPPKTAAGATSSERPADAVPTPTATLEGVEGADPAQGKFTLADATAGLAGTGPLTATIKTSHGELRCTLFDDRAPITVANFVGLARGVRPFKSETDGRWIKAPFYDGTTFHRVIKGFMIQGGDRKGNGTGDPGYEIPDEIWPGARHDRAGQLCMANRGPNTNGGQFFVTEAPAPALDGKYTIFGECTPTSVVTAIATVPKGARDRPLTPVTIDSVTIAR